MNRLNWPVTELQGNDCFRLPREWLALNIALHSFSRRLWHRRVVGCWHGNRHALVTEFSGAGTGDEVIMSIAGHVSRAMLTRYSHVRMEAKRRALEGIAARQKAGGKRANRKTRNASRKPVQVPLAAETDNQAVAAC